jgi:hypothetical protein
MQSNPNDRIKSRSPEGVGLALVAMPYLSIENRHAGERRPYIQLPPSD